MIERPSDIDMFSFASGPGTVTLSVSPAARSANLDLLIELRNSSGALLASANPVDSLPASLSYTAAAAATYYVGVQGIGKGDPLAGGYTDYGSVGQYAISWQRAGRRGPAADCRADGHAGLAAPCPWRSASPAAVRPTPTAASSPTNGTSATARPRPAARSASHVYSTAGSYAAQLKVTDNAGLTATRSVTITATSAVVAQSTHVADIAMRLVTVNNRSMRALADVTVRDADGRAVPGATVNGSWSGLVSGNSSAVTDGNGVASLQSPGSRNRRHLHLHGHRRDSVRIQLSGWQQH